MLTIAQQHKHECPAQTLLLYAALCSAPLPGRLFFILLLLKLFIMHVYIVSESSCAMVGIEQLKIVQVAPQQQAAFLKKYAGCILVSGSSVSEVLAKFGLPANG
jgi:hypothetical protein